MLLKLERWSNRITDLLGYFCAGLMLLTMVNVFYDAIMRYFFRTGSIALQEMEWHMFSVLFLFGIAYTLKEDGHVRVDLIYDRLGPKAKALINIAGTFFFLIPLALLILTGSLEFVEEAFRTQEISGDPGGLTHRYLIKAMIPLAFAFLIISAVGFVIRNINVFRGIETLKKRRIEDEVL